MKVEEIIKQMHERGFDVVPTPERYSFGTYEECCKLIKRGFQKLVPHITDETFVWLPEYDEIARWMSDTHSKGLFLSGNCGTGKSIIVWKLLPVLFSWRYGKALTPVKATDINKQEEQMFKRHFIVIDDVGYEDTKNSYGEKINVFSNLVDEAETKGKVLLATTNLTGSDVINKYGTRTLDRIVNICKTVKFTSGSLRGYTEEQLITLNKNKQKL